MLRWRIANPNNVGDLASGLQPSINSGLNNRRKLGIGNQHVRLAIGKDCGKFGGVKPEVERAENCTNRGSGKVAFEVFNRVDIQHSNPVANGNPTQLKVACKMPHTLIYFVVGKAALAVNRSNRIGEERCCAAEELIEVHGRN